MHLLVMEDGKIQFLFSNENLALEIFLMMNPPCITLVGIMDDIKCINIHITNTLRGNLNC